MILRIKENTTCFAAGPVGILLAAVVCTYQERFWVAKALLLPEPVENILRCSFEGESSLQHRYE
eukprot:2003169-Amphidinium_carterae.1